MDSGIIGCMMHDGADPIAIAKALQRQLRKKSWTNEHAWGLVLKRTFQR